MHIETLRSLAGEVVLAEASDLDFLRRLHKHLAEVADWAAEADRPDVTDIARKGLELLDRLVSESADDPGTAMDLVGQAVAELQAELEREPTEAADTAPDDSIMAGFLADQKAALEEIEELALGLEDPEKPDVMPRLRGRVHTLKGEAGVLSLQDVSAVCHAVENAFEELGSEALEEYVLSAVDWLRRRFRACEEGTEPPDPFQPSTVTPTDPADRADNPAAPADEFVELTGEPELLGEFVPEAREHLEGVDDQLLKLEREPTNEEALNSVFRAFHTIKGLAGFLELGPVQRLAHEAETMLDRARSGALVLAGRPLALTFEVTDVLKRLNASVEEALAEGGPMRVDGGLQATLSGLQEVLTEGDAEDDAPVPEADPAATLAPNPKAARPTDGVSTDPQGAGPGRAESTPSKQPEPPPTPVRPSAEEPKPAARPGKRIAVREMIKVDATRLDALVDTIGELVIAEAMVSQSDEIDFDGTSRLPGLLNRMDKITRELQEMAMSLRMVPIRSTFRRMARLARDVASKVGKRIDFRTVGEDTELDKTVVDTIGDPLIHMVRNAVDHGLEKTAEERVAAGKPGVGQVELRAFHQSGSILVEIEDDGRGLDPERIMAKARQKGIVGESDQLSENEIYDLIFAPGFSTAQKLTDVSGRGVGLDVVRRNIEALRGSVEIRSTLGRGSVFSIRLPLTLAIIDGMVVRVGGERYIFPTVSIVRMVRPEEQRLTNVFGRGALLEDGERLVSLFHVGKLFELPGTSADLERTSAVIVEQGEKRCAFLVDEILGQQQIVIKPLGPALAGTPGLAGGAIMPDGQVGLILDVAGLVQLARSGSSENEPVGEIEALPASA